MTVTVTRALGSAGHYCSTYVNVRTAALLVSAGDVRPLVLSSNLAFTRVLEILAGEGFTDVRFVPDWEDE